MHYQLKIEEQQTPHEDAYGVRALDLGLNPEDSRALGDSTVPPLCGCHCALSVARCGCSIVIEHSFLCHGFVVIGGLLSGHSDWGMDGVKAVSHRGDFKNHRVLRTLNDMSVINEVWHTAFFVMY